MSIHDKYLNGKDKLGIAMDMARKAIRQAGGEE